MSDIANITKPIQSISKQQCSVGLVEPQTFIYSDEFPLCGGQSLPGFQLVYETYGRLNADKSNAVLICHALSGDHHAAGYHSEEEKRPGWWDNYIGPGKAIDTDHFFVVALNNLGGCAGSTGPTAINPETNLPWGHNFPQVRVRDWVDSQFKLMQHLGIDCWSAVIGGSLGGMQAMRWSLEYPQQVKHCVVIASALKLTAQNIGFNDSARTAIVTDPEYQGGDYLRHGTKPSRGVALARMIGHMTYLSDDLMGDKFGRELRSGSLAQGEQSSPEFQVGSYLQYQGSKFAESFDANTYLLMLRALDYFDLAREYGDDPVAAFQQACCKFLVVSFTTDWRFAPARSREIVNALIAAGREVTYANVNSAYGHDAFLLPVENYEKIFSAYMKRIAEQAVVEQQGTSHD